MYIQYTCRILRLCTTWYQAGHWHLMSIQLFTQRYWRCLDYTLLVYFFPLHVGKRMGSTIFDTVWSMSRTSKAKCNTVHALYGLSCTWYDKTSWKHKIIQWSRYVDWHVAMTRGGVTPIGTVSRAVTAVKIFDHPKIDLTAGRLTNCTRRKCSAIPLDCQQCWFWQRIQLNRQCLLTLWLRLDRGRSSTYDPYGGGGGGGVWPPGWPWSLFFTLINSFGFVIPQNSITHAVYILIPDNHCVVLPMCQESRKTMMTPDETIGLATTGMQPWRSWKQNTDWK